MKMEEIKQECTECKKEEVVIDFGTQLESHPPKYPSVCLNCGYISYWAIVEG